ncbi:MAG: tetratricopeptide repeat protein [Actinobacteria bacterium]|nr:tetratricopeptide repeat protein [Actinomycetota bacterium]
MDADLYQDAIQVAERGLQIMPLGTSIRVQLAHSLVATGRMPEAVEALEYCVQIDPTGGEAAAYLAGIYQQQGDPDKALELLRSVEALAPGQPGIADAIRELEAGGGAPIQSR